MPETQFKRLHDSFVKITNNLFVVSKKEYIFVHKT